MHRFTTITFALSCVAIFGAAGCSDDDDEETGGTGGTGVSGTAGNGGTAAGSGGTSGAAGSGGSAQAAAVVTCPATPDAEIQAGGPAPFTFTPGATSIGVGDVIQFRNTGTMVHDARSGAGGVTPVPDGKWASGDIAAGASVCMRFQVAGTYPFYCSYHPATMTGTITVQ